MRKVIEAIKEKLNVNYISKMIKYAKSPTYYNARYTCCDLSAIKRFRCLHDKAYLELFQRYMGRC